MQHRFCRVQIQVQRREATSITNCDSFAVAGRPGRNAFAYSRRNTEYDSVPNADGANADTITPLTRN